MLQHKGKKNKNVRAWYKPMIKPKNNVATQIQHNITSLQHKCKRTPTCDNKETKQDTTQCSNKTNAWYNKKVKKIRMSEHGTTR